MRKVLLVVAVLAFVAVPTWAQETSRADFEEWVGMLEGRWLGNFAWAADWPGMGKKGEKVNAAYWEGRVIQDGHGLETVFYAGTGSERGLIFYDARQKRIRWSTVDSGGTVGSSVFFKKDGKWTQQTAVSYADGTGLDRTTVLTVSDGGNTWTWQEPGSSEREVWRRLGGD